MPFHIGQKVVCVDDTNWCCPYLKERPRKGIIYTIRGIVKGRDVRTMTLTYGVILEELINPIAQNGDEHGFMPRRFRPVIKRKTDISIFTQMLTPNLKEKIKA